MEILLVAAAVLVIASFRLYRSADKAEERFENKPRVIKN